MLKTVRHHAKSQGLNPGLSLGGRSAVREYAGQLRYLGDPAPVSFAFELDSESHGSQPGFILRPTAAQSGEHRVHLRRRRSPKGEREAPPPSVNRAAPKGAVRCNALFYGPEVIYRACHRRVSILARIFSQTGAGNTL